MNRIKCFLVEPTGRKFWQAGSRSDWEKDAGCAVHGKQHRAEGAWNEGDLRDRPQSLLGPELCACGHRFSENERTGSGSGVIEYRRADSGELLPLGGGFPVGAMLHQAWLEYDTLPAYGEESQESPLHWWHGPDGLILGVMTPGGMWSIDSRASNCTMPADNKHRCWVRHGAAPDLTVDKNGLTCQAGAGSIQCGSYHGFLRNGYLEEC